MSIKLVSYLAGNFLFIHFPLSCAMLWVDNVVWYHASSLTLADSSCCCIQRGRGPANAAPPEDLYIVS